MSQIQWFPGHMAKARREVGEKLGLVDIVIELVDARIPQSSRNPMIDEIIQDKRRLVVLNKADLADPALTQAWIGKFEGQGLPALAMDAQHNQGVKQLEKKLTAMMADKFEDLAAKGVKPRPIRLMIVGIPNVGKSTLINRLVGKNQAQTGHRPGVTRAQRWLKVADRFELLDTPGILWPKFEDPVVAKKLAVTGAIKDSLLYMDDLALFLIDFLKDYHPEILMDRYQLDQASLENLSSPDLLLSITEKMGFKDDFDRASDQMILHFRQGSLGRISLDRPEEDL